MIGAAKSCDSEPEPSMIAFRILVLIGMIRLLIATDRPDLCAGIYGSVTLAGALLSGESLPSALVAGLFAFVLSGLYFWLLKRFDSGIFWWVVLVAGFLIGLV
jgi:hypothetical protein